jgi:DNA-binding IscR family transcriptional regulator
MRQLSKCTHYGLRALYALARQYERGPVLIANLARTESIPRKFLEQFLPSLNISGLVLSRQARGVAVNGNRLWKNVVLARFQINPI